MIKRLGNIFVFTVCAAMLLGGCSERSGEVYVKNTLEVDGCTVKTVNNPRGYDFYIAQCGATTTTTGFVQSGRITVPQTVITAPNDVDYCKKVNETEKARLSALSKLSPEDKKALGIK